MCRAIDFLFGTLDEDNRIFGYFNWSERRFGRTVGYVVVGEPVSSTLHKK